MFSLDLIRFLCLFLNPAFFSAPVSLQPLDGSTDQAAHYHLLTVQVLRFTC